MKLRVRVLLAVAHTMGLPIKLRETGLGRSQVVFEPFFAFFRE